MILLHGPVGSAKSTIARLLKKGLEALQPRTRRGAAVHLRVADRGRRGPLPDARGSAGADPRRRPPRDAQASSTRAGQGQATRSRWRATCAPCAGSCTARSCARCHGDFMAAAGARAWCGVWCSPSGIAWASAPSSPRTRKTRTAPSSRATSTTGLIAEYGSDSDPRAFNFDGEFNVANRGLIEFIEVLKLDVAFLYDLLGASQEHRVKPKKFAQTHIDEVIIGHTNEPEFRKPAEQRVHGGPAGPDESRWTCPYITKPTPEARIYDQGLQRATRSPRTSRRTPIHMAALWAVLTRLEDPTNQQADAGAEGQAVRRAQSMPGVHRGPRQGAAQDRQEARGWRASAPATSRTRSATRWSATRTWPA